MCYLAVGSSKDDNLIDVSRIEFEIRVYIILIFGVSVNPTKHFSLHAIIASLANQKASKEVFSGFEHDGNYLTARLPILGSNVAIRVAPENSAGFAVGAVGLNPTATRWLHDVLVTYSTLTFTADRKEIQVIRSCVKTSELEEAIFEAARLVLHLRIQEEAGDYSPKESVAMYWSSGVLNFGDWSGPHIVRALTGKQPVQGNRPGSGTRVLYSVGSILGWIKRNNVDVWGSGLMRPLTEDELAERRKLTGVKIHAVRGSLTKGTLENDLGWQVPDVFGDPALLLPDVVSPAAWDGGRVAFVPHNVHRSKYGATNAAVDVIDARRDAKDVARSISAASAVVSSSLHGIIVAQAYGVPWVWLNVVDHQLFGATFKFEDFFTCLDRNQVSRHDVRISDFTNLDVETIAAEAELPKLNIDLNLLRAALPVAPASRPLGLVMPA